MKTKIIIPSIVALFIITGFTLNSKSDNLEEAILLDNYKVIKVDGRIVFQTSGKDMHTGDQFVSNEKIKFVTEESRAAVISKQKGRFVLTPDAKSSSASNLLPAMNNVSSRAGALINAIDLKNHFSDNYLILGEMELKVGKDIYPMNKDNFFYLQYAYGEETVPKILNHHGDTLEFTPKDIFTIDGKEMDVPEKINVSLYYRDNINKKSVKISNFNLVTPKKEQLIVELEVITGELDGKDSGKIKNEVTAYLVEFYGKPQKENLADWLKKNMKL